MELLLKIDAELREVPGVTLAEGAMDFRRIEQLFLSSLGSEIYQLKTQTGAGYVATSFAGTEIQRRSYPNSFGGQYQTKGYELVEELKLLENAPPRRGGGRGAAQGRSMPVRREGHYSR